MQYWSSQRVASVTLAPSALLLVFILYSLIGYYSTYSNSALTRYETRLAALTNGAIAQEINTVLTNVTHNMLVICL